MKLEESEIKNKNRKNSNIKNMSSIREEKNSVSNRIHYSQKNYIKHFKQKTFSFKEKPNKRSYNKFYYLLKHKIKLFLNDINNNNYNTIATKHFLLNQAPNKTPPTTKQHHIILPC